MAIIGQPLLQPESGWRRYDNTDINFEYIGSWVVSTSDSHYNSTSKASNDSNSKLKFTFKGTKLRIISLTSENRSNTTTISIDNSEPTTINLISDTAQYQVLIYEIEGLTNTFHNVEIDKGSDSLYFNFDAIDIDENGILGFYPSNKFLILSNDEKLISKQGDIINYLPSQSEQNFINYGMDKSTEIDLNLQLTKKVFIEQTSTTLGDGKVFKSTIDTTKTPIKKVSIN